MHKRTDYPEIDPSQQRRLRAGGLDEVWTDVDPLKPFSKLELAA